MNDIVRYLICFLLGEQNSNLADQVAYGKDYKAKVIIIPSVFFEDNIYMTLASMPQIPLKKVNGVPILFGNEKIERNNKQIIIYADIIASAYFLITRYEECLNHQDRDSYGRFIGKKSLPYRAGFFMRPVVDEYGKLLRGWLRETGTYVSEPDQVFKHIYLTHDIDQICQSNNLYWALRITAGKIIRHEAGAIDVMKAWFNYEKYDEIYNAFAWLADIDQSVVKFFGHNVCSSVYFVKGGGNELVDDLYYKYKRKIRKLLFYLRKKEVKFGFHASMSAGLKPKEVLVEKEKLEAMLGQQVTWNRNHFLCSKEPEDMEYLISAGITDDFTLGYADIVGFRLGTSRAVQWIDPHKQQLTPLVLHPLTVMECTLDYYMNLEEEEAFNVIWNMLETIKKYNGEAVLLWHNTSVVSSGVGYQRRIYERVLEKMKNEKFGKL